MWDPVHSVSTTFDLFAAAIFDILERLDGENCMMSGEAERRKVTDGGKIYCFFFGRERPWSDREPVKSEDSVTSLRHLIARVENDRRNSNYLGVNIRAYSEFRAGQIVQDMLGVRAIHGQVSEIKLSTPAPEMVSALFGPVFAVTPSHFVGNDPADWHEVKKFGTKSPFVLASSDEKQISMQKKKPLYRITLQLIPLRLAIMTIVLTCFVTSLYDLAIID